MENFLFLPPTFKIFIYLKYDFLNQRFTASLPQLIYKLNCKLTSMHIFPLRLLFARLQHQFTDKKKCY